MATITNIHEHAESMLDFSIERDEWDEFPMISIMYASEEDGKDFELILMAVADAHPAEVLESIADRARSGKLEATMLPLRPVLGISLQVEGWGLIKPSPEDELLHRAGVPISELASRVEVKNTFSYDGFTNRNWTAVRDGEKSEERIDTVTGRIPDAVREAFEALAARAARAN